MKCQVGSLSHLTFSFLSIGELDIEILALPTAAILILILALIAWLVIRKRRAKVSENLLSTGHLRFGLHIYRNGNENVADVEATTPRRNPQALQ